jgi:ferredoxin-NADP reductase
LSVLGRIADAFAWPLRASHYLELVNPLWSTHALQARVESVWDETADARTLVLRPGRNWRAHRPGQYIRVGVPIDGKQFTRTYSISSAPADQIAITVKAIGRVSQHLVREIKPGDYLPIGIPQGDFVLPDATPIAPLFISAGSGITPIMSMLRSMIARDRLPHVTHVHYAPHAHDVIFGEQLRALQKQQPRYTLQLQYTRDRPNHLGAAQLDAFCPDWRTRETYACGPQSLLDMLEEHFAAHGLSKRLHMERFRAKVATAPSEVTRGTVSFAKSNLKTKSDGVTNLLRIAEDAGLNPPHGCRMGICHGCDATLKSGCVRDLRNNALLNEPGQTVQICVCAAAGDAELEL